MSAKQKAAQKARTQTPKLSCPPIPEETLDRLIARYSVPVTSTPDESTAALWDAVADLKGWLQKKGKSPTDPYGMRFAAWQKLRSMLNDAVEANDASTFDSLAKAWETWEMKKPAPRAKQGERNPWEKENEQKIQRVADSIESLIPALPANKPNAIKKIRFLEAIRALQRELNRAPTRWEIEQLTLMHKTKVTSMANEMGFKDSLSRARTPVN